MPANNSREREVKFEIVEHLGNIAEREDDWNTELNIVRWNEGKNKYDIRAWSADHKQMTRGITLFRNELDNLVSIYNGAKNAENKSKVADSAN